MIRQICILLFLLTPFGLSAQSRRLFEVRIGKVEFSSEAPKELISASSKQLSGLIDPDQRTFSFRVPVSSFRGFNNPLQREHFNENYLESRSFPDAMFSGKIMEPVDLAAPGVYQVRGKGRLSVHGIAIERLVPVKLTVARDRSVSLESDFTVPLADHAIKIPRVVYEKLSPEIKVHVVADLQLRR